jgi:hypothetical protein
MKRISTPLDGRRIKMSENEKQEQPLEASDIKETRELFEKLGKMKAGDLIAEFEKEFYVTAVAAINLFERISLNSSNAKKRTEAAKYLLSFFRDANFTKNLGILREIGARKKGTAPVPDQAQWKTEPPKPKKG